MRLKETVGNWLRHWTLCCTLLAFLCVSSNGWAQRATKVGTISFLTLGVPRFCYLSAEVLEHRQVRLTMTNGGGTRPEASATMSMSTWRELVDGYFEAKSNLLRLAQRDRPVGAYYPPQQGRQVRADDCTVSWSYVSGPEGDLVSLTIHPFNLKHGERPSWLSIGLDAQEVLTFHRFLLRVERALGEEAPEQ